MSQNNPPTGEPIAHDDKTAHCTKVGWEAYQKRVERWRKNPKFKVERTPYIYIDVRPSGRFP